MKVAIFGQVYYPSSQKYIEQLFEVLKKRDEDVWAEESFYQLIESENMVSKGCIKNTFTELDDSFDLFFSIGGDGTILSAVKYVKDLNIPIVGINTGRLGFLATIHKEEVQETIHNILNQKFSTSERSLLEIRTNPTSELRDSFQYALNEFTIIRKDSTSMITIETWLDDEYINAYWSDGIIVSTPTGSTGYSLSCGGPIMLPDTSAFVITPIAPHNLNARPLLLPDHKKIRLKVKSRESHFLASLDSRTHTFKKQTEIFIAKAPFTIQLVLLHEDSFLKTLRKKLLWGEDRRNLEQ
ncbi:MAG: NAD kinase [Bacteroidota bacterium]